jgi:ABC-type nitrate/sulfonate/bicarbonate transport system substrate-binding protein
MRNIGLLERQALLLGAFLGAVNGVGAADKVVFTSAINVPFAPNIIAVEQGFAKKHGLDAEYKIFEAGGMSVEAVVTKNAQVAICADLCLMIQRAKGGAFALVARTSYTGTELGIGAKSAIKKPSDLAGKKIGYFKVSPGEQFFEEYFKKHGLDTKGTTLLHIAPPEWLPALARGDIDAFFGWEPWLTKLPSVVPDGRVLARSGDDDVYTMEFGLVMDKAFLAQKPAVAERALAAVKDAVDFINSNPKEAARIVAKAYRISPDDAERYLKNNTYVFDLRKTFIDRQRSVAQWVNDRKIANIPDVDALLREYVAPGPIQKVAPRNTDY